MIKSGFSVCFAVAILSLGSLARAQDPDPRSAARTTTAAPRGTGGAFEFGLRTGYGLPLGHTGRTAGDTTDDKLSSSISGEIPLWLDLGYRFDPNLYLGLSFQYAFGFVPDGQCTSGASCSVSDLRLDANFMYHLTPDQAADFWVGFGAGYEWLRLSASALGFTVDGSAGAFEFANFQVGVDIAATPVFALGPFVSFSLGQYRSFSLSGAGQSSDMDVEQKSLHEWLMFGVRGTFDIHR
jgi:hypothetical protein